MKAWIRRTWLGCVVALTLGAPAAHASGGSIMFSGAIVEPTCAVGPQRVRTAEANGLQHYHCTEQAGATPDQAAQSYALSVTALSGTALASDRLIGYFANYLNAEPTLVTQTYE